MRLIFGVVIWWGYGDRWVDGICVVNCIWGVLTWGEHCGGWCDVYVGYVGGVWEGRMWDMRVTEHDGCVDMCGG